MAPSQYSSGGKARLRRITKAGNPCTRSLPVLGACVVFNGTSDKTDTLSRWAIALAEKRDYWRAIVAIPAKNARMAWPLLARGESFAMPA